VITGGRPDHLESARAQREQYVDLARLVDLLAADAVAFSDGGGKVAAAIKPIHGSAHVARYAIMFPRKQPNVFWCAFAGDKIAAFYVQRNPDQLRRLVPRHSESDGFLPRDPSPIASLLGSRYAQ
jgi:hypothetical protein